MTHTKHTILVVEDNDLNSKLFRDILVTQDYEVLETKDGDVAVQLAIKHRPAAIIMDIQLKGVSGFDIIKQMKANPDIKHIPIIAVTAFAMKDDKKRILASGCDAYVPKPISISPFLEVIKTYVDKNIG